MRHENRLYHHAEFVELNVVKQDQCPGRYLPSVHGGVAAKLKVSQMLDIDKYEACCHADCKRSQALFLSCLPQKTL